MDDPRLNPATVAQKKRIVTDDAKSADFKPSIPLLLLVGCVTVMLALGIVFLAVS